MELFPRSATATILFLFLFSHRPTTAIRLGGVGGGFAYIGRKVGGRSPIEDVGTNREIQDLGRFSVAEYNRMHSSGSGGGGRNGIHGVLVFSRVLEAERQVVAGMKYYLKIEATTARGFGDGRESREVFESVVVVRPWKRSKVMLDFGPLKPSSPSSSSAMIHGS